MRIDELATARDSTGAKPLSAADKLDVEHGRLTSWLLLVRHGSSKRRSYRQLTTIQARVTKLR